MATENTTVQKGSKVNTTPIWWSLTNFTYDPSSPESWVRLGCQVCFGGMAIIFLKALDGNVCGQPWTVALPQTWGNPVGCFIRSLVQNVPDNFLGTAGQQQQPDQVIQPPIQQQQIQPQTQPQQNFNQPTAP
ncbi:MAG TPA: hypothetical protein V6C65_19345 [Allocoleopsis sp.]